MGLRQHGCISTFAWIAADIPGEEEDGTVFILLLFP